MSDKGPEVKTTDNAPASVPAESKKRIHERLKGLVEEELAKESHTLGTAPPDPQFMVRSNGSRRQSSKPLPGICNRSPGSAFTTGSPSARDRCWAMTACRSGAGSLSRSADPDLSSLHAVGERFAEQGAIVKHIPWSDGNLTGACSMKEFLDCWDRTVELAGDDTRVRYRVGSNLSLGGITGPVG